MPAIPRLEDVCIPPSHPCLHDWRMARMTELLLMGHTRGSVRHALYISKPEFDQLLEDAIDRAKFEQREQLTNYLEQQIEPAR